MENIGKNIKFYRKQKGYSQKQLAEELGLATGTIQQYELDKREPKFDTILKISNVLDINPYNLYGIEEPDTTESEFIKACQWLEEAEISIDAPDEDDGLQQYYLYSENEGTLEISCKMDKTDIIHLVNECVNDANKTRDDIAIKYIKRALKSQK